MTNTPAPPGHPHYEVVERIDTHETVVGRYETRERAEGEASFRRQLYSRLRLTHGEFIVRYREL